MSAKELEEKFREGEALGRMIPTKMGVAKAKRGDTLRVASMAAISKPDGSVRPLHDGTHSVKVNHANASNEPDGFSGIGGVCFSSQGVVLGFFSKEVPDKVISSLKIEERKQ